MRLTNLLLRFFVIVLWAASSPIQARSEFDEYDPAEDGFEGGIAPWRESAAAVPDYPADADLLAVPIDTAGAPFSYYLDRRALSSGPDGVVRYTVVIESSAGARNVVFEGIRCATREYRSYAFGGAAGDFAPAATSIWQPIRGTAATMRHREQLYAYYFCDGPRARILSEILRRIRYPDV